MAAKRLGYLLCFCLSLLAVLPARGNENEGTSAPDAELPADVLILAIEPTGEDHGYKLVEIGDTKAETGIWDAVVDALPLGFLGLGPEPSDRPYDETAEIAQCRAACRADTACRDVTYVRPNRERPVGVCRLQRLVETASFGVMDPVPDEEATPRPEPQAPKPSALKNSATPPRVAATVAEYIPLPPRAEPTGPPRDITVRRPLPAIADAPQAFQPRPAPRERKPLPLWLALGSVAFMFGGAGLYWHSYRRRMTAKSRYGEPGGRPSLPLNVG